MKDVEKFNELLSLYEVVIRKIENRNCTYKILDDAKIDKIAIENILIEMYKEDK